MQATVIATRATECHASLISTVMVAIAPGPASIGMPSGMIAASSLTTPSLSSSGLVRTRERCARSISSAIENSRIPPAILNAPSVMPNSLKMNPPAAANTISVVAIVTDALSAVCRFLAGESPCVIDRNIGITANGSTTKKIAENVTSVNERSSGIGAEQHARRGPGVKCLS
jgi:hypothetical protein